MSELKLLMRELEDAYPQLKSFGFSPRHLALFNEHELASLLGINEGEAALILGKLRALLREAREIAGRKIVDAYQIARDVIIPWGIPLPRGLYRVVGDGARLFLAGAVAAFLKAYNEKDVIYIDCGSRFNLGEFGLVGLSAGEAKYRVKVASPANYADLEDLLVFEVPRHLEKGNYGLLAVEGLDSILVGIPEERARAKFAEHLVDWVRRLSVTYDVWAFVTLSLDKPYLPGRLVRANRSTTGLLIEIEGSRREVRLPEL